MSIKILLVETALKLSKSRAQYYHNKSKEITVTALRTNVRILNKIMGLIQPIRKDIQQINDTLGGLFCFHTLSPVTTKSTILYLHGGGYVMDLHTLSNKYHYIATELAAACAADVWAIDYRIAPEYPYPAAIDDAYRAYLALLEKGIAANDMVVMGDSAGGGMTIALLMKLRDNGTPLPKAAIAISPWTDLAGTGDSMTTRTAIDPMFISSVVHKIASEVVSKASITDPYISPLYGNFVGLPPLMIVVGGREILYDDSIRVAEKGKIAGVDITLDINEKMFHVYPLSGGIYKEGKDAIDRMAAFLQRHLKK